MRIDGLTGWDELLAVENQSLVIAERGAATVGESSVLVSGEVPGEVTGSLVLCVGPEGGWSVDELVAAEAAGATRVGLGRHVLRIETAAVALAAAAGFFSG
jgi:16S rRNA (uracil1498-N3)-methyltransferase